MFKPILRTLPLAVALACGSGWAATSTGSSTSNTGPNHSTLAGVSAAQPGSPADTTHAAGAAGTSAKADAKLSHKDKEFIEDAAKGGMFEVQSGQLAAQKGSDQSVKDFGNKLAQDHGKANDELKQIADAKGVKMPDKSGWGDRHEVNKLQKLSGPAFDREFAKTEVKDHEKDIKDFEKAAKDLKDPELKAWAEKQIPALKEHLALAQKLSGAEQSAKKSSDEPNTRAAGNTGTTSKKSSKY